MFRSLAVAVLLCVAATAEMSRADTDLRERAMAAMRKAAAFYHGKVASHGGYVYFYSEDLTRRWGEGEAAATTIFVQPPGTPTVGMAYLTAFAATKDSFHLDAARDTALSLVRGQLESGGWAQVIHFGPAQRIGKYRGGIKPGSWNMSSLDDDQTQAALRFLMRCDQAMGFKHAAIHEAALYGLDALLKAQFANGAFPQGWTGPVADKPVIKAGFPDYDWKTQGRVKNYWDYYTLNDNLAGTVCRTLIEAHQVYGDAKYKAAVEKLGDFLILAQMPSPQPGWCQQYNYEMKPMWARKFEPPAITGGESQDVMETLILIARYTGKAKYLEPIPPALKYFETCLLPDGKVARYYELKTNKPLYMDEKYELTYDGSNAPSHYGWTRGAGFKSIAREYEAAKAGKAAPAKKPRAARDLEPAVNRIIGDLDAQGRWVSTFAGEKLVGQPKMEKGFRYISSEVFARNMGVLCEYVEATNTEPGK